jgi:hypothetical protein
MNHQAKEKAEAPMNGEKYAHKHILIQYLHNFPLKFTNFAFSKRHKFKLECKKSEMSQLLRTLTTAKQRWWTRCYKPGNFSVIMKAWRTHP